MDLRGVRDCDIMMARWLIRRQAIAPSKARAILRLRGV
jgi:hypothetical protein